MKRVTGFLMACIVALPTAYGQVQLTPQIPPQGLTLKSQLWNVSVINTSGSDITAKLQMSMVDQAGKRPVLSALSRSITIGKGAKQLRLTDLMPIEYLSINPDYGVDGSPDGFLPIGNFVFCYTLQLFNGKETISEECTDALIEPLAPPMLISPADNEQLEETSPVFTWSPPAPRALFKNLVYDFKLTEVIGKQTASDAIQKNIPLLFQQNINNPSLQYPLSAPKLDSTKVYAWQITARNYTTPVGNSEAWLFKLKKRSDTLAGPRVSKAYFNQLVRVPGTTVIAKNNLSFAYLNESNNTLATLHLYDITNTKNNELTLTQHQQPLHYGENFVTLDLAAIAGMVNQHFYLLELINATGEHWYIKFQYKIK